MTNVPMTKEDPMTKAQDRTFEQTPLALVIGVCSFFGHSILHAVNQNFETLARPDGEIDAMSLRIEGHCPRAFLSLERLHDREFVRRILVGDSHIAFAVGAEGE